MAGSYRERACPSSYCNIATQRCRGCVTQTAALAYSWATVKKFSAILKGTKYGCIKNIFLTKLFIIENFQIYIIMLLLLNAICFTDILKVHINAFNFLSDTKFRTLVHRQCSRPVSEGANLNQNVSDLV